MIKALEKRADWFTTDLYQMEPWDKDAVKGEADKYRKYGLISLFSLMASLIVILFLCAIINQIVLGDLMPEDLEKSLLVLVGFTLGGIYGIVTILGKFEDKLERGY